VPCLRRARQMEYTEEDSETQVLDENNDGDDGWMYTHSTRGKDTTHDLVIYIFTSSIQSQRQWRKLHRQS
jgi:ubiquitin-like-conjugating enzyme ATG3